MQKQILRSALPAPLLLLIVLCFSAPPTLPVGALQAVSSVTGDLRLHSFTSHVFSNARFLRVLVPPGYDDPKNQGKRYPVLYLNDGQDLFDPQTSLFNRMEWRVDETVHDLVATGAIPPLIVVGIDSAGRQARFKEYFPWVDSFLQPPEPHPQGEHYPAFLVDEVMPFINARYRTLTAPEQTGIGGSSAGALAALYAAIHRPGVFGRLLIESPSIYLDDYHILREASHVESWPERIFLGVGTNELGAPDCRPDDAQEAELVHDVRELEKTLLEKGVKADRIRLLITPCAQHNEQAWAERLPSALRFLFGTLAPSHHP